MSNIYIQEPPTNGKVVLSTSIGDIEVELWSKEAPLACRNFVQLCMENYYNNTIFHRVIPGFIAQGGDPEGTGVGGESIYGKPFKDEFHSRLRFVRRGLVGMANSGPDDNGAQFFFTLGPTKELQNKNTIFGKVTGDTLYNLPRFEEGEIDKDDRPVYPHKITKTEVLINPFTDIVPREKIQNEISKEERKKKKKKGIKNFSLLSFGGEAEEEEETVITANKELGGGGGSEPSLVDFANVEEEEKEKAKAKERIKDKLRLLASGGGEKENKTEGDKLGESSHSASHHKSHKKDKGESKRKREEKSDGKQKKKHRSESADENSEPVSNVESRDKTTQRENSQEKSGKDRKEVRDEIKQLQRELYGKSKIENEVKENKAKEEKADKKSSAVQDFLVEKQKYISDNSKALTKKTKKKESFSLSILEKFKNKVRKAIEEEDDDKEDESKKEEDWLTHKIVFDDSTPVLAKDASSKDDSWYALDDPRHPLNKQRREESGKKKSKSRHR